MDELLWMSKQLQVLWVISSLNYGNKCPIINLYRDANLGHAKEANTDFGLELNEHGKLGHKKDDKLSKEWEPESRNHQKIYTTEQTESIMDMQNIRLPLHLQ